MWRIDPNPCNSLLAVNISKFTNYSQILIYNSLGIVLIQSPIFSLSFEVDIGNFFEGIYYVELIIDEKTKIFKRILKV